MGKDQKKLNSISIAGLLLGITSIVLVFVAIYLTPDFVLTNLSKDGILEPVTLLKIKNLRIITGIIGILGILLAALFLIKNDLIYSIISIPAIRKNCLSIIIGIICFYDSMIEIMHRDSNNELYS